LVSAVLMPATAPASFTCWARTRTAAAGKPDASSTVPLIAALRIMRKVRSSLDAWIVWRAIDRGR
jgi:hypothetical protein